MPKTSFPIEEVARQPVPGNVAPSSFAFSSDDSILTYLYSPEHTLSQKLFALDLKSGERHALFESEAGTTEENVSAEEALRRERQRQRVTGVTHYEWASGKDLLLVPFPDGLYVQDGLAETPRRILEIGGQPALDPRFSPDGKWVSYVQDAELYVVPVAGGEPRQLTQGARGTGRTHGLAEFVAQEEMARSSGYWWSPDSKWLAFEEVDETDIPLYRIVHQGKDALGPEAEEEHHYPFAGQPNAKVRLGVIPVEGGEPLWLELGNFEYLARVAWMPDGSLTVQLEDRNQSRLNLVAFDLKTGSSRILLTESSPVWINLHDMFYPLPVKHRRYPGGFIWGSERSGFMHLYLYDGDANLIRTLTQGEWVVDGIAGVDARRGIVYFTGRMDSPLESHLYAVSLDGEAPRRITRESGMHAVTLDHACKYFVDVHDSASQPPHATLRRLSTGSRVRDLYVNDDPRVKQLKLRPPEFIELQNRDGVTLHGALYRPQTSSRRPLPTIIQVYGGPFAQTVTRSWGMTAFMRVQLLRSLGYVVLVLDNRGSAKRGLAFEGAVYRDLGNCEVQDQVDGVHWLVEKGITDPARVGVHGWSYGGYMTLMCLCRAPDVFKVGVAGAPVTYWAGYDTHYTERYMGTPANNPDGYSDGSVLSHVEKLQGKLLLVHGLIDENVHFRHTARLINALIRAGKHYDLLLFPDERHSPRRTPERVYLEQQIRDYFLENL